MPVARRTFLSAAVLTAADLALDACQVVATRPREPEVVATAGPHATAVIRRTTKGVTPATTASTTPRAGPTAPPSVMSGGVEPPEPPATVASGGLITHAGPGARCIALTFDACQTATRVAGYDHDVIHTLQVTRTPATLFLGGLWMRSHPGPTQAVAAEPLFELGNHSWSHPDFTRLSPNAMVDEIGRTQAELVARTGRPARLFRFPFGAVSGDALQVVAAQGLRAIQWDIVTGDPDPHISARRIIHAVAGGAHPGAIIVMHMNGRGWHTAAALPTLIHTLRARGYTLVTVSQLLD